MKNLILILSALTAIPVGSHLKRDTGYIQRKDLIGVWQRNFKEAGNGLMQNFRFYSDSTFEVHFSNPDEDARDIWELKGTYRLAENSLFLTIKSRVIAVGGQITLTGSSENDNIFHITGGTRKEIMQQDPKESPEYISITVVTEGKILLDNETYYKMTKEDLKNEGIERIL